MTQSNFKKLSWADQVSQSQQQALLVGRPMLELLQAGLELTDENFVQLLGLQVQLPVLAMAEIHQLRPALDVLPFSTMLHRECLLLRDASDQFTLVLSDPFDVRLRRWDSLTELTLSSWNKPIKIGIKGCKYLLRVALPQIR